MNMFERKVIQMRELEGGFCNPLKIKEVQKIRDELREDLERRGFDKSDIEQMERDW